MNMRESDIFEPLQTYLQGQGYSVHAEVNNCDVVAKKGNELIIVELKKSISLNLLAQAVKRKEISESVYIAVPVPVGKQVPPNFRRIKELLRRLEIGCILVYFLKTKAKVRIELHPFPFNPRTSHRRKRALLREIDGRYAEFNKGGEPVAAEKITAYKQQALRVAHLLLQMGPASPAQLRQHGGAAKTQVILSQNVYGWFEREKRGVYRLHPAGRDALEHYAGILKDFNSIIAYAE